jgi:lipooligosaccharide transport system permease protein
MTRAVTPAAPRLWTRWLPGGSSVAMSARLIERHVTAYRGSWPAYASGIAEPFLYLFSIGIGVGALVGDIEGPNGPVSYEMFVAPALLAAATMNGALLDTTINFFVKFKYMRIYDPILATPLRPRDVALGEILWSLLRGSVYAAAFVAAMVLLGLTASPWTILALPAAVLIGFAFTGAGLAGSTFMTSWVDFDYVNLAIMPMFLFSATFFPLDQYPAGIAGIVNLTPLYQGVAIERALVLGDPTWALLPRAAYLAAMGTGGFLLASHRLQKLVRA